jgi:RHS repeat-associated protein
MNEENGLNYIRARYYSPEVGRFITKDPQTGNDRDGQSLNRYVYALNNPVVLVDISGLSAQEGDVTQDNFGSSDSLHSGLINRVDQIKIQALMAELDYIAALEIEALYWDAWADTLEGIKGALGTVGGLFTGGPIGAVSGILNQLSTLSDVAGAPDRLTKTLKVSSDVIGIGTSVYGGYKDISNIQKLGGISRTGQLTLGTNLWQNTRVKLIYSGLKISQHFVGLLNVW